MFHFSNLICPFKRSKELSKRNLVNGINKKSHPVWAAFLNIKINDYFFLVVFLTAALGAAFFFTSTTVPTFATTFANLDF